MYNNSKDNTEVILSGKDIWSNLNSYFKDKDYFLSLYKRTHNLSSAVFLVSNNIEDNDILKSKIKDACVNLLSLTINLKDLSSYVEIQKVLSEIEGSSLELISFLDIASISGSVSKMNADIIKNEFNFLLRDLSNFKSSLISKDNKVIGETIHKPELDVSNNYPAEKHFVSDKNIGMNETIIKDKNSSNTLAENGKRHNRKETRKSLIFDFIFKHKNSSIKDIVPNIKGCSEKTVQREIMDLIKEGKIKKEGERRWSKYSALQTSL